MKKIFLMILALPLIVLAEDAFPTGRVPAEGQSPTDVMPQSGPTETEARSTAHGAAEPPCKMCVTQTNLTANTSAAKAGSGSTSNNSNSGQGATGN